VKLGTDVDGVTLDSGPLYHAAFKRLGLTAIPGQLQSWYFDKIYGTDNRTVDMILGKVAQIINVSLVPGAQILNKIVEFSHIELPIHFVTSRPAESWGSTKKALERHFSFPFLLSCVMSKGKYCNENELDFFVEDGPPHIKDIFWRSNTHIYVLDKPYNQALDLPGYAGALRVKNWSEILVNLARKGFCETIPRK